MFLIIVSKLILLKEKIQGPLEFSSRSKTRRMRTFIKRWLDGSLQHFWSGDHHLMVWTAGHQQHCIVSEFYAHCDVITRHLKMRVVGTPSLVVQLPHVNMPAAFPCTYVPRLYLCKFLPRIAHALNCIAA